MTRDHEHVWKRQDHVTTRGYKMPVYETCPCGATRVAPPEDEVDLRLTGHQVVKGEAMRITRLDADEKPLGQPIVFRAREGGRLAVEIWNGPEEDTP